ncbi:MAG: D-alanyl-D-alanine carboxypeptidase DacF precursor [Parcubacteria group bacterium ADurb.Bin326]|nr:MAG: D-alanyl-D-alanine carboxypeptidase DacF precursor [Parcubacteria group bacterium ADurb.Bin326]
MFKKIFLATTLSLSIILLSAPFSAEAAAKASAQTAVRRDLQGRFVVQKDNYNKLWYFDPQNKERYLIRDGKDIELLTELFSVDISNSDFSKISKNPKTKSNTTIVAKYKGKFIKFKGDIYYVNPGDGLAYYAGNYRSFINTAKVLGARVSDASIKPLSLNSKQLTYDPLDSNLAYTSYDGVIFSGSRNSDQVLPLASLTKLMTALVFVETDPDWSKIVEITPEQIAYPCTLQACGTTSEIPLKAGDKVMIEDLWIALLTASSNQSAKILADNSGLTTEEFVAKMNQRAKELGLTKTKFVEMSGLSPDNISTAEEFAKFSRLAFDNFFIAVGTNYRNHSFMAEQSDGSLRRVSVANRNYSLLDFGVQASKTGFLTEAQRNVALKKDGKIIVVLHALSMNERNEIITKLISGNGLADAR